MKSADLRKIKCYEIDELIAEMSKIMQISIVNNKIKSFSRSCSEFWFEKSDLIFNFEYWNDDLRVQWINIYDFHNYDKSSIRIYYRDGSYYINSYLSGIEENFQINTKEEMLEQIINFIQAFHHREVNLYRLLI